MYPEKMKTLIQTDTCIPMFIATLLTITKIWRLNREDWITHIQELYFFLMFLMPLKKKNEILPFATMWMYLKGIMQSEIIQRLTLLLPICGT